VFSPATLINTNTPLIQVNVTDLGLGVAPDSLKLWVDNVLKVHSFSPSSGLLSYQIVVPLSDGLRTVRVRAADASPLHNAAETTWTFTIDTQDPAAPSINPLTSPTRLSSIIVSGKGEPNGTIEILVNGAVPKTQTIQPDSTFSVSGITLVEGAHSITGQVTDAAGNPGSQSPAQAVLLDTQAPLISGVFPADGSATSATRPTVSAQVTDGSGSGINPSSLQISLNSIPLAVSFQGNQVTGRPALPLAHGRTVTLEVLFTDVAGNSGSHHSVFTIDTTLGDVTPPVFTNVTPASGAMVNDNTPPVSVNVNDNEGTVNRDSLRLWLDDSLVSPAYDEGTGTVTYTPAAAKPDGVHSAKLRAQDNSGNRDSVRWTFTIDGTSPASPLLTPPASPTNLATIAVEGKSETRAILEIYVNGSSRGTTVAADGDNFSFAAIALQDGVNQIQARATDTAGNSSGQSALITVFLDRNPPAISGITPDQGDTIQSRMPAFSASLADGNGESGIDSSAILAIIDQDTLTPVEYAYSAASGQWSYTPAAALAVQTAHTFRLQVRDRAGNAATPASVTFVIDTASQDRSPPTVSGQTPAGLTNDATPVIFATVTDPSGVNAALLQLQIGSADSVHPNFNQGTGEMTWLVTDSLPDGEYPVRLRAADSAGNSCLATWSFTVDVTPPPAPVLARPESLSNQTSLTLTGANEANVTLEVFVNSVSRGTTIIGADTNFVFANIPLTAGVNLVRARVQDAAGNKSAYSNPVTVFVDTQVPAISSVSPANGDSINLRPNISAQLGDAQSGIDSASIRVILDADTMAHSWASGVVSYRPATNLSEGVHQLSIRVRDRAGNNAVPYQGTFVASSSYADRKPPQISGMYPKDEQIRNNPPEIGVFFTDAASNIDSLSIRLWVDFAPVTTGKFNRAAGKLTYKPVSSLPQGLHQVKVRVADDAVPANSDSMSWVFVIDSKGPSRPNLSLADTVVASATLSLVGTLDTAEASFTVRVYRDTVLVASAPASDTLFTVNNIALESGNNRLYVVAEDALGNPSVPSETVLVVLNAYAPQITAVPPVLTIDEDTLFSYQIIAGDLDGQALGYRILLGPDTSMHLDSTGRLTWRPTQPSAGAPVQIEAADGFGRADTVLFVVVVRAVAVRNDYAPQITPVPSPLTINEDTLFSYQISATDGDGQTLIYRILQGPDTTMHINQTGRLTWLPTQPSAGVPVQIEAADGFGKADTVDFVLVVRPGAVKPPLTLVLPPARVSVYQLSDTVRLAFSHIIDTQAAGFRDSLIQVTATSGLGVAHRLALDSVAGRKFSVIKLYTAGLGRSGTSIQVDISGALRNPLGGGFDGNGDGNTGDAPADSRRFTIAVAYLGDFNLDSTVSFGDLSYLSNYWYNSANDTGAFAEIGPALGATPQLQVQPDQRFDYKDLGVFVEMWFWSKARFGKVLWPPAPVLGKAAADARAQVQVAAEFQGDTLRLDLNVTGARNIVAARAVVQFDTAVWRYQSTDSLQWLEAGGGEALALDYPAGDAVEINLARISAKQPAVSGAGILARICFAPASTDVSAGSTMKVAYELLDRQNAVAGTGWRQVAVPAQSPVAPLWLPDLMPPETFTAYPVPASRSSESVHFSFTASGSGHAEVSVYDLLGNRVHTDRVEFTGSADRVQTVEFNPWGLRNRAISTGGYLGLVRVYSQESKTWRQWQTKLAIKD
jgi:hypothetical protein